MEKKIKKKTESRSADKQMQGRRKSSTSGTNPASTELFRGRKDRGRDLKGQRELGENNHRQWSFRNLEGRGTRCDCETGLDSTIGTVVMQRRTVKKQLATQKLGKVWEPERHAIWVVPRKEKESIE